MQHSGPRSHHATASHNCLTGSPPRTLILVATGCPRWVLNAWKAASCTCYARPAPPSVAVGIAASSATCWSTPSWAPGWPQGARVWVPLHLLHTSIVNYTNPTAFDPERWRASPGGLASSGSSNVLNRSGSSEQEGSPASPASAAAGAKGLAANATPQGHALNKSKVKQASKRAVPCVSCVCQCRWLQPPCPNSRS